jgi:phytoene/squalene synthetase
MQSMEADLTKGDYQSVDEYRQYIYGSADVVGLMCLRVLWVVMPNDLNS